MRTVMEGVLYCWGAAWRNGAQPLVSWAFPFPWLRAHVTELSSSAELPEVPATGMSDEGRVTKEE